MRIRRIHLKNIHSLKGEHTLDLSVDPISSSGIFLITGPTGSGKSTLLDVISLALFNQIPRVDRKLSHSHVEGQGMLLTRGTKEAFAEVEYECREGVFISKWQIESKRTGGLRDYHMELARADGTLLDLKKSEVPVRNEELIGLNYEQLIRSMILAQGQFAKFLRSGQDEKGKLLERITGTHIFRDIGRRIYESNREIANKLQELQTREDQEASQLLDKDKEQELRSKNKDLDIRYEELNQELLEVRKELERVNRLETLRTALQKAQTRIDELQVAKKSFDSEEGPRLKAHRDLIPFLSAFETLQSNETEIERLQKEISLDLEQSNKAKERLHALSQRIRQITGVTSENPLQDLESFQLKVQELQQRITDTRKEFQNRFTQLVELANPMNNEVGSQAQPVPESQLEDELAKTRTQTKQLSQELHIPENADLKTLRKEILKELDALHQIARIEDSIALTHKEKVQLEQEKAAHAAQLEKLPAELALIEAEIDKLGLQIENAQKDKEIFDLHQRYGHLLEEGHECPLCGSLEHPSAHKGQDSPILELDKGIGKLRVKQAECIVAKGKLQARITELRSSTEGLQVKLAAILETTTALEQQAKPLRSALSKALTDLDTKQAVERTHLRSNGIDKLESLQQVQLTLERCIPVAKEIHALLQQGKTLRSQFSDLYDGEDPIKECGQIQSAYQESLGALRTMEGEIDKIQKRLYSTQKSTEEQRKRLEQDLLSAQLPGIDRSRTRILQHNQYDALVAKENELEKELAQWQREHKTIAAQIQELNLEAGSDKALLLAKEEELKVQTQDISKTRQEVFSALSEQDRRLAQIALLKEEQEEISQGNKGLTLLNKYIGDAQGKKFANYAQELTLRHLLQLANDRLQLLNKRYQLTMPDSKDSDIEVVDMDMGMMQRSVRTLSGGETFQVSLALALGLSDLAARHVEIDCLFIDEGFGTLDPETLDQTLATLEKLQAQTSKVIGLISHVGALKERINVKVNMIPDGMGMSRMEIQS